MRRAPRRCLRARIDATVKRAAAGRAAHQRIRQLQVVQGPELRTIFFGMDQFRDELLYSRRQGQEPVQGRARAQGALPGDRRRGDQALGDARRVVARRHDFSPALNGAPNAPEQRACCPTTRRPRRSCWPKRDIPNGSPSACSAPTIAMSTTRQICLALISMLGRDRHQDARRRSSRVEMERSAQHQDVSLYMSAMPACRWPTATRLVDTMWCTPAQQETALNAGRYSNAAFDALLPKIAAEIDQPKAQCADREAVTIERNDVVVRPAAPAAHHLGGRRKASRWRRRRTTSCGSGWFASETDEILPCLH